MTDEREAFIGNVIEALSSEEVYVSRELPEISILSARPAITRKTAILRQKRKRKIENRILLAGYSIFVILAAAFVLEYAVNGPTGTVISIMAVISGLALMSMICIPVFRRLNKENHMKGLMKK